MIEQLRDMEKARQEMKRKAFEKLPEVADSLSEHIVFIGNKYTTPNQGFYDLVNWLNGAWYAWQAAQEQMLQTLYQDKRNGFFSYDGFGNYSRHDNLLEAKREAELAIDYFADQLADGSFHPDGNGNFQDVGYGVILGTSSYSVDHVVTQDDVDNGEYSYPVGTEILSLNLVDIVRDQPQQPKPNAFLSTIADMGIKIGSGDYVLVPKKPTFQMYQAFKDVEELEALSFADRFNKSYKAMLEAANK